MEEVRNCGGVTFHINNAVDDKKLGSRVSKLYDTLDRDRYPETAQVIKEFLDTPLDENIYLDEFAYSLDGADVSEKMDPEVAKLYVYIISKYANMGNALALNNLGSFYYNGRSGKPNYKKAREYYEKAHEEGYVLATENLADMYFYGNGVKVDYETAFKYYTTASLLGDDYATMKLGDMYKDGLFIDENKTTAFFLYDRAFNTKELPERVGHARGCKIMRVADCFYEGIGVEKNVDIAFNLYARAEYELYDQIRLGDTYHFDLLERAIKRQLEIRSEYLDKINTMYGINIG